MGWACKHCTFLNEDDAKDLCGVCDNPRKGDRSLALLLKDSKSNRTKTGGGKSKQMTLFGQVAVDPNNKKQSSRKVASQKAAPTVANDKK